MFTLMREGFLPIKSEHLFILPKFRLLYRLYRARLELSGKGEFIKVDNPHAAVAMPVERGAVYALPSSLEISRWPSVRVGRHSGHLSDPPCHYLPRLRFRSYLEVVFKGKARGGWVSTGGSDFSDHLRLSKSARLSGSPRNTGK